MQVLEKIQARLNLLRIERARMIEEGRYLQGCWLVLVKPGGTARTNRQYWQIRSRQRIFDGKTLKHIQPTEVESYTTMIDRGRQLKQIDREINKLQRRVERFTATSDPPFELCSIGSKLVAEYITPLIDPATIG